MDAATTEFALKIAGVLIIMFGSTLWWFIRDKIKTRERYLQEKMDEQKRKDDLLEKRLNSGTEAFNKITTKLEQMWDAQVRHEAQMVSQPAFDSYCKVHEADHRRIDKVLEEMTSGFDLLASRLDTGIKTMTDLLARHIEVPGAKPND